MLWSDTAAQTQEHTLEWINNDIMMHTLITGLFLLLKQKHESHQDSQDLLTNLTFQLQVSAFVLHCFFSVVVLDEHRQTAGSLFWPLASGLLCSEEVQISSCAWMQQMCRDPDLRYGFTDRKLNTTNNNCNALYIAKQSLKLKMRFGTLYCA